MSALTDQDAKIIDLFLGGAGPLSGYAISKATGISETNVKYRLGKLKKSGVVLSQNGGYVLHPVLLDRSSIKLITSKIEDITKVIDAKNHTPPEGMKILIEFIIQRTSYTTKSSP